MALNFNANQYELAFRPTKLCNWEVVRKPTIVPKRRVGATKIIANDRGHLLPGIRKLSQWKDIHPAIDTENCIKLSTNKMGHSDNNLTSWERRSSHVPFVTHEQSIIPALPPATSNSCRSSIDNKEVETHRSSTVSSEKINTSEDRQHLHQTDTSQPKVNDQPTDDNYRSSTQPSRRASQTSDPVLASVYSNDLVAKNLKFHNQKHHTLADAVDISARSGTSKSQWLNAEARIDNWIPAVGRKLFQSPGPTQCSKLKIFRPKTTVQIQIDREETPLEKRPNTAPRSKRLSEMDLAIYWDVTTPLPPKKTEEDVPPQVEETKNENILLEDIQMINTDEICQKQISPPPVDNPGEILHAPFERKHSSLSNSSVSSRRKQIHKSISNLPEVKSDRTKPTNLSDVRSTKLYASAPNLVNIGVQVNPINFRTTARMCEACNVKPSNPKLQTTVEPYKLAFKAGKPNTPTIDDQTLERLYRARHLTVPKPKVPYAKKSYSIGTLVPPFSVWPRAAGQDYPDHWRLASVYQHSYKPLETRKVPFIKTIFQ